CQHKHDYTYTLDNGLEDLEMEFVEPLSNSIGQWYSPLLSRLQIGAPTTDHTTNSGKGAYFLFMNRNGQYGSTPYIDTLSMTDLPKDESFICVRFAYQTYGNATLEVFVGPNDANNYFRYGTPVWTPR